MRRAAIGLRVSTEKQRDEGYSLPSQLRLGLEYAAKQGVVVPEEYIFTEVYTGTTGDRPELNKIKDLARSHLIDIVIIFNSDRYFRNRIEAYLTRKFFAEHNVELHYAEKGRKVGTTLDDEILNGIEELIAEVEKGKIKERTMRGRWERAEMGTVPGQNHPPYGYIMVSRLEGKKSVHFFEINPDQAQVVSWIYDWYVIDRMTIIQIRDKLTSLGVPCPGDERPSFHRLRGYGQWHVRPIYRILAHEAYRGELIVRRVQDNRARKMPKTLRDPSEWLSVPVPPIIETVIWEKAQVRLAAGKRLSPRSKSPNTTHLFARRVKCSCGASMRTDSNQSNGRVLYYRCLSGDNVSGRCASPLFRRDVVDGKVWEFLVNLCYDPEFLMVNSESQMKDREAEYASIREQLRIATDQLARNERMRDLHLDEILNTKMRLDLSVQQQNEIIIALHARQSSTEHLITGLKKEISSLESRIRPDMLGDDAKEALLVIGSMIKQSVESDKDGAHEFRRGMIDRLDLTITLIIKEGKKKATLFFMGIPFEVALESE